MLRTRLLWFTAGFSLSAAAIGHFLCRDLVADRYAFSADAKKIFDDLEARLSKIESDCHQKIYIIGKYGELFCYHGGIVHACMGIIKVLVKRGDSQLSISGQCTMAKSRNNLLGHSISRISSQ